MKPSCPPSILADEGVGIGPCGWERGTGGRVQGRSRRERFPALIAIERYLASRGIAFKNPDQTHTPHHGIQSPGRAYQRGADATQPVRTGTQTAAALDREDVWPQHSSYTHGILPGRRSSSAQCGNSCKSGSSRVLSERGGRRKILFRWRGSQEDTLRKLNVIGS